MKQLFISALFLLGGLLNGNAQQPSLKFNKDGKFKIVQFTDVHYIYENPKSAISIERINEVLDAEKPDLVLFTGDVIYGKPAEEGMRKVLKLASDRKIPFGITFGNHDNEQGLTRTELFDIIKTIPYNLTDSVKGVSGSTASADTIISNSTRSNGIVRTVPNTPNRTEVPRFLHWHSSISLCRNTTRRLPTKQPFW